jgi:hypothetical protein
VRRRRPARRGAPDPRGPDRVPARARHLRPEAPREARPGGLAPDHRDREGQEVRAPRARARSVSTLRRLGGAGRDLRSRLIATESSGTRLRPRPGSGATGAALQSRTGRIREP